VSRIAAADDHRIDRGRRTGRRRTNEWTQFEDFPLFMKGVEHMEQKEDTRLHWVAKIGGKTEEWDAKILEQHPDKQVSWISEDGKTTCGTVTFEQVASRGRGSICR
jgi:uncharacterized membrane protein